MVSVKRGFLGLAASAAVAVAAAGFSPALLAQGTPSDDGHGLFNQHCSACHTLDNATNKHLPEAGWREIVERMVNNGAEITPADQAVIVAYLTKNYGAAPAPAKGP